MSRGCRACVIGDHYNDRWRFREHIRHEGEDTVTQTLTPPSERLLLDVDEVAELLGVSKSHCYVLMNTGRLRYVKSGRRRLIRRSDLDAFVAALTSNAAD
jgi:excisionase family DNA binding protein